MRKLIFAVVGLLMATGCAGQNKTKTDKDMNAIVIFFSHAGDNYSVGDIKVGNTKIVADYISVISVASDCTVYTFFFCRLHPLFCTKHNVVINNR